MFLSDTARA
jgi:hypothetical protein